MLGQHDQREREEQRELDVLDRLLDRGRRVVEHVHGHGGGQLRLHERQQVLDPIGHFDRVRAGLPLDGQGDGPLRAPVLVAPGRELVVLDAVENGAEVFEPDGRPVAIGHDQGLVLRGAGELARGLHRVGAVAAPQHPFGIQRFADAEDRAPVGRYVVNYGDGQQEQPPKTTPQPPRPPPATALAACSC